MTWMMQKETVKGEFHLLRFLSSANEELAVSEPPERHGFLAYQRQDGAWQTVDGRRWCLWSHQRERPASLVRAHHALHQHTSCALCAPSSLVLRQLVVGQDVDDGRGANRRREPRGAFPSDRLAPVRRRGQRRRLE